MVVLKWVSVCVEHVRLQYTCDSFREASDVRYSRCRNRAGVDVGLSVGISVTVGVSSDKVRVVVRFLLKTFFSKLLFKKKIYLYRARTRTNIYNRYKKEEKSLVENNP